MKVLHRQFFLFLFFWFQSSMCFYYYNFFLIHLWRCFKVRFSFGLLVLRKIWILCLHLDDKLWGLNVVDIINTMVAQTKNMNGLKNLKIELSPQVLTSQTTNDFLKKVLKTYISKPWCPFLKCPLSRSRLHVLCGCTIILIISIY